MGGLAGGRVRSICKRGIPKKKSRSRHSVNSALRVIRIEGKITSIMLQNNRYFFVTKMLPAQNL